MWPADRRSDGQEWEADRTEQQRSSSGGGRGGSGGALHAAACKGCPRLSTLYRSHSQ